MKRSDALNVFEEFARFFNTLISQRNYTCNGKSLMIPHILVERIAQKRSLVSLH